jgi:rare lipoprotein A
MTWQRLLCVGFCAVALTTSAAYAAPAETSPPATHPRPVPAKKAVVKSKVVKAARAAVQAKPTHTRDRKPGQVGYASWYGGESNGKSTASGGRFNKDELTAAHRTLPLESKVLVTNMANGRSVTVRITDRGPSRQGRIIDLSQSAAEELGMRSSGLARVHVEPVFTAGVQ